MKFRADYEIEIDGDFGAIYMGKALRRHFEDIEADDGVQAATKAEYLRNEIPKQYIGSTSCRICCLEKIVS